MEISKIKLEFLKRLEIDIENLPDEFNKINHPYEVVFTREERKFVESNDYTASFIMPFCMKDICGTNHPSYENMTFLESFSRLKRGDENIRQFYYNPSYYSEKLRQQNQSSTNTGHDTPLELYRLSDGRCVVNGGNNRINIMMMLYLSELSKVKTEEEKEQINKKYTFYAEIRSLPKNKDVSNTIFLLKDKFGDKIKFQFIGNDPEDCHYNISLNGQLIEIKNIEELKRILVKSYDIKSCANFTEFYETVFSIVFAYTNALVNAKEGKARILSEICPDIRKIKEQFFSLRKLTISTQVFDNVDIGKIDYSNLSTTLQEVIDKIKEQIELKQINDINEGFITCTNKNNIINLIHKIEMLSPTARVKIETLLPNYSKFVEYFNEVKTMLPEEFSNEFLGSYSKVYSLVLDMTIQNRKNKLEASKQQEQILKDSSLQLHRRCIILTNKGIYEEVKSKDLEIRSDLSNKEVFLKHEQQNKQNNENKKLDLELSQQEFLKKNIIVRLLNRKQIANIKIQLQNLKQIIDENDRNIESINGEIQSLMTSLQANEDILSQACGFKISLEEYEEELITCQEQNLTEEGLTQQIFNIKNNILKLNIVEQENKLKEICSKNGISLQTNDNEFISDMGLKI